MGELKDVIDKLYINPPELSEERKIKLDKKFQEARTNLNFAMDNNNTKDINKYRRKIQRLTDEIMQINNFIFSNQVEEKEARKVLERAMRAETPVEELKKIKTFLEAKKQELNRRELYQMRKELNEIFDDYVDTEVEVMQISLQEINEEIDALQDKLQDLKLKGDFEEYHQQELELQNLYEKERKLAFDIRNREIDERIARKLFIQESLLNPQAAADKFKQLLEEQELVLFNKKFNRLTEEIQEKLEIYNSYLSSSVDRKAKLQTEIKAQYKYLEAKQALKSNVTKHEQRIAEIMKELADIARTESKYKLGKKLTEAALARANKTQDNNKKMEILLKAAKKE